MDVRATIESRLIAALGTLGVRLDSVPLEHPSDISHGDYATGIALAKAKEASMNPRELAEKIVAALDTIDGVSRIDIAGPGFINFTLSSSVLAARVEYARATDMWGSTPENAGKKIMVEYTDPNPFKEFHIGHLMSNAIGESISRLLQFTGAEVSRANYGGDVGPHVAKGIWGIQKLGLDPANVSDLGVAYVEGAKAYENDPEAKSEIDVINAKVYSREDESINAVYDVGRKTSLEHFEEIYKLLGTKFDFYFFESESAPRGLARIGADSGIFTLSDGAVVYAGSHTRVFITSKGLPTYEAKEIGLAEMKREVYPADEYLTITASEQDGFFKVVYEALEKIFPDMQGKVTHVSHGMMRFADGKMSSRTGNVITGESLIRDLVESAKIRAAESRADDHDRLSAQVAVAAIKYQVLRQAAGKNIIFDREKALSLEGDSGPYLQYAHARTNAIMQKAKEAGVAAQADPNAGANLVERLIPRFPEIVSRAAGLYEPHVLTTYLLELASAFNAWYAQEQILDGTSAGAHKLALVEAVNRTLKNGLWILGIPTPEKM